MAAGSGKSWRNLAPWGFPGYEINRQAEVRTVGSEAVHRPNELGAIGLVDAQGRKRCRTVGKLCRLAYGASAPGASKPRAKLSPKAVAEIRRRPTAPTVIAAEFGVSPSTVKAVRARRIWEKVRTKPRAQYETDEAAFRDANAA